MGAGMALTDYTHSAATGASGCEATEWQSSSTVRARSALGVSHSTTVAITSGIVMGSASKALSFDGDIVSGIVRANGISTGSTSLTVLGSGFGILASSGSLARAGTAAEAQEWVSDTAIRGLCSHGVPGSERLIVSTGMLVSSISDAVSYDKVALSSMPRANVAATGAMSVTVAGSGLGLMHVSATAKAGESSCESSQWHSATALACLMSATIASTRRVVVTVGSGVGSATESISTDIGSLSVASRAN
eukprot:3676939-Rhodomonas_salina.1